MNSHEIFTSYKSEGGTNTIKSAVIQAETSVNIEVEIPPATVNKEITVVLPITTMKTIMMSCSKKSGDSGTFAGMTVKTNSSGSPDNTFLITPSNGLIWSDGDPNVNPITVALLKIFVSNAGSAVGNFTLRSLVDPTP